MADQSGTHLSNRLLASLSADEYQHLHEYLKPMQAAPRQVLHRQGDGIEHVFFPNRSCVCSVTKATSDGGAVQVAGIGSEGFVGTNVVWGARQSPADVTVHIPGDGVLAMPVPVFLRALESQTQFRDAVSGYLDAFARSLMQSVACNAMHSAEQRCCRWFLETADRVQAAAFPLTHEYLAAMLGVRRPTVTLVCSALQQAGVISYRRGFLAIVDRAALQAAACDCYDGTGRASSALASSIDGRAPERVQTRAG